MVLAGTCSCSPGSKWGFIDARGKRDSSRSSLRSLATRWQFVDHKGKVIIPRRFDAVGLFQGGLARVRIGDKTGYIDKKDNFIWKLSK